MSCSTHADHAHVHSPECKHPAVRHEDHVDYLHDGHLHHPHDGHTDEHKVASDKRNRSDCHPDHDCGGHEHGHRHADGCGHPTVPHDDHKDHLVAGHLHHFHGDHCDDHGPLPPA